LQHLLVHSHQNLLFRSHPFPCSPPPSLPPLSFPCSHHPTLLPSFSLHLLPVHLPVLRQRQLLYLHILARHHISRHLLPQLTPHLLHFQLSPFLLHHHIPHQPLVLPSTLSFSLFHQHHRLLHPLALLQRSFDLLQLDPISTDFYLLILPPQILQLPLSPPPHLVPRPIQPPSSSSIPSSSTYACVFPIGFPIAMLPPPSNSSFLTSWQQLNVVFSVGPYPLITFTPATPSTTFFTCLADSTSPPASSCLIPFNPSTPPSTTAFSRLPVSHAVLTPLCSITSTTSSTPSRPLRATTSRPPFKSAPQISNVDASKAIGAYCNITSCSPNST